MKSRHPRLPFERPKPAGPPDLSAEPSIPEALEPGPELEDLEDNPGIENIPRPKKRSHENKI